MPERLGLHSAADLVELLPGRADHVGRVGDPRIASVIMIAVVDLLPSVPISGLRGIRLGDVAATSTKDGDEW